jgi:hypothetical protein
MRRVAFLTDIEGRWDKLADFCAGSPLVTYDEERGLRVASDALFVFGGDAIDRGPAGRKIVRTLLAAKRAQPDQVVLLAGNRDLNKLRLARELDGEPPPGAPAGSRADLLRFVFSQTMGARDAFEHRRAELATEGRASADEDVVDSWLEDVAPDGPLTRYLSRAVLAHREEETLFLHGGVTGENLGLVPGRAARIPELDRWLLALNELLAGSIAAFAAGRSAPDGTPLWQPILDYQAPVPGTRLNQASVVYARTTDPLGNPVLPPEHVIAALRASGVRRVVVGHTPTGDCPSFVRDRSGFALVLADNSYGRIERGSRVTVDGATVRVEGTTLLDSGAREEVACELALEAASPLGLRDAATGRLVKAQLARGPYLMYRAFEGRRIEQRAATADELDAASLLEPRPV